MSASQVKGRAYELLSEKKTVSALQTLFRTSFDLPFITGPCVLQGITPCDSDEADPTLPGHKGEPGTEAWPTGYTTLKPQ